MRIRITKYYHNRTNAMLFDNVKIHRNYALCSCRPILIFVFIGPIYHRLHPAPKDIQIRSKFLIMKGKHHASYLIHINKKGEKNNISHTTRSNNKMSSCHKPLVWYQTSKYYLPYLKFMIKVRNYQSFLFLTLTVYLNTHNTFYNIAITKENVCEHELGTEMTSNELL